MHGQAVHVPEGIGPATGPAACGLGVGITGMLGGATQTPLTSAAASTVVITVGVPVGTPPLTSDSVTVVVSTYCSLLPLSGAQVVWV